MAKLQAPNYTQLPNALIALLPSMSEAETKIAIIIARETFGWHRPKVKLSLTDLMEHTGLTRPAVIKGVKKGIKRGILGRQRAGQGFLYFLIVADEPQQLPDQVVKNLYQSPPTASKKSLPVPVKNLYQQVVKNLYQHEEERKERKKVKEKNTHNSATKLDYERAPECVRVGSKFSLQECRSYARHLKTSGEGITNPGGYATTIHRSGEADALIEEFLNPSRAPDVNQCPDCRGMGVYYPLGIGIGAAARCKHEKLIRPAEGASR